MQDVDRQPLVSIIVITYNSALFVLETLESAKSQTYQNLELIISDDHSADNTVDVCNKWLAENKHRFVKTDLLISAENSGTTMNCNRGLGAASGKWLKFIAGDDLLLANCVQTNIDFVVNSDTDVSFVFSKHIQFKVNKEHKKLTNANERVLSDYWDYLNKSFFVLSAKRQYIKLLKKNYPQAATVFIKKETLISVGGFDNRVSLIEDYPLWLKVTSLNYKLFFIDSDTILYRLHENSISNSKILGEKYVKNNYLIYKLYKINRHTLINIFFHISVNVNHLNMLLIAKRGKRTWINKLLQLLNPYFIENYFFNKHNETFKGSFIESEKFN